MHVYVRGPSNISQHHCKVRCMHVFGQKWKIVCTVCNSSVMLFQHTYCCCALLWCVFGLVCRVVDAAKAKAIQSSAGAPSDGERDAHELLRTLVRKHASSRCSGRDRPDFRSSTILLSVPIDPQLIVHPGWFQGACSCALCFRFPASVAVIWLVSGYYIHL